MNASDKTSTQHREIAELRKHTRTDTYTHTHRHVHTRTHTQTRTRTRTHAYALVKGTTGAAAMLSLSAVLKPPRSLSETRETRLALSVHLILTTNNHFKPVIYLRRKLTCKHGHGNGSKVQRVKRINQCSNAAGTFALVWPSDVNARAKTSASGTRRRQTVAGGKPP